MFDCTLVVRSIGERTCEIGGAYPNRILGEDQVATIELKPFSAAVKKTFRIGLEKNKKWTLALDGDILLKSGAIEALVNRAESLPDSLFMIQGRVLDKLFCFARNGGPHLFRTSMLEQALALVPDQAETLRPEAETVNRMVQKGFHRYKGTEVYGIHDFEQYYRDVFCTAFAHAIKFPYLQAYFMKEWKCRETFDADYTMARMGYALGTGYTHSSMPDREELSLMAARVMDVLEIDEKGPIGEVDVKSVFNTFEISAAGRAIENQSHATVLRTDKPNRKNQIMPKLGKFLERLGKRLQ